MTDQSSHLKLGDELRLRDWGTGDQATGGPRICGDMHCVRGIVSLVIKIGMHCMHKGGNSFVYIEIRIHCMRGLISPETDSILLKSSLHLKLL
jgi:hypothetical protein